MDDNGNPIEPSASATVYAESPVNDGHLPSSRFLSTKEFQRMYLGQRPVSAAPKETVVEVAQKTPVYPLLRQRRPKSAKQSTPPHYNKEDFISNMLHHHKRDTTRVYAGANHPEVPVPPVEEAPALQPKTVRAKRHSLPDQLREEVRQTQTREESISHSFTLLAMRKELDTKRKEVESLRLALQHSRTEHKSGLGSTLKRTKASDITNSAEPEQLMKRVQFLENKLCETLSELKKLQFDKKTIKVNEMNTALEAALAEIQRLQSAKSPQRRSVTDAAPLEEQGGSRRGSEAAKWQREIEVEKRHVEERDQVIAELNAKVSSLTSSYSKSVEESIQASAAFEQVKIENQYLSKQLEVLRLVPQELMKTKALLEDTYDRRCDLEKVVEDTNKRLEEANRAHGEAVDTLKKERESLQALLQQRNAVEFSLREELENVKRFADDNATARADAQLGRERTLAQDQIRYLTELVASLQEKIKTLEGTIVTQQEAFEVKLAEAQAQHEETLISKIIETRSVTSGAQTPRESPQFFSPYESGKPLPPTLKPPSATATSVDSYTPAGSEYIEEDESKSTSALHKVKDAPPLRLEGSVSSSSSSSSSSAPVKNKLPSVKSSESSKSPVSSSSSSDSTPTPVSESIKSESFVEETVAEKEKVKEDVVGEHSLSLTDHNSSLNNTMENKEVTKTASSASSVSSSSDSSVEEKEEESVVEVKDVLTPGSTSHVGAVPVLALSSSPERPGRESSSGSASVDLKRILPPEPKALPPPTSILINRADLKEPTFGRAADAHVVVYSPSPTYSGTASASEFHSATASYTGSNLTDLPTALPVIPKVPAVAVPTPQPAGPVKVATTDFLQTSPVKNVPVLSAVEEVVFDEETKRRLSKTRKSPQKAAKPVAPPKVEEDDDPTGLFHNYSGDASFDFFEPLARRRQMEELARNPDLVANSGDHNGLFMVGNTRSDRINVTSNFASPTTPQNLSSAKHGGIPSPPGKSPQSLRQSPVPEDVSGIARRSDNEGISGFISDKDDSVFNTPERQTEDFSGALHEAKKIPLPPAPASAGHTPGTLPLPPTFSVPQPPGEKKEASDSDKDDSKTDTPVAMPLPPTFPVPQPPEEKKDDSDNDKESDKDDDKTDTPVAMPLPPTFPVPQPPEEKKDESDSEKESDKDDEKNDTPLAMPLPPTFPVPHRPEEMKGDNVSDNDDDKENDKDDSKDDGKTDTPVAMPLPPTFPVPQRPEEKKEDSDSEKESNKDDSPVAMPLPPTFPVPQPPEEKKEDSDSDKDDDKQGNKTDTPVAMPLPPTFPVPQRPEEEKKGVSDSDKESDKDDSLVAMPLPPTFPVPQPPEEKKDDPASDKDDNKDNEKPDTPVAMPLPPTFPVPQRPEEKKDDSDNDKESDKDDEKTDTPVAMPLPPTFPVPQRPEEKKDDIVSDNDDDKESDTDDNKDDDKTDTPVVMPLPPTFPVPQPPEEKKEDSEKESHKDDSPVAMPLPPTFPVPQRPDDEKDVPASDKDDNKDNNKTDTPVAMPLPPTFPVPQPPEEKKEESEDIRSEENIKIDASEKESEVDEMVPLPKAVPITDETQEKGDNDSSETSSDNSNQDSDE